MKEFEQALEHVQETASYSNKERKLDEALRLMGRSFTPELPDTLPKLYYGDAMTLRVRQKQHQLQAAAPAWVQQGGDKAQLESLMQEFEHRGRIATFEWDIYYRRSDDAGKTWNAEQRLVSAPGNSHRPQLAVAGDALDLVWWVSRDGNDELYYKHSPDRGHTWSEDLRLTRTPGDSRFPMVAATRDAAHVIWTEGPDGRAQIYYQQRAHSVP